MLHGFDASSDREGGHGDDCFGESFTSGDELICWNYLVYEADAEGLGGWNHVSGEEEFEGRGSTDEAGEALGSSVAGDEAELDLGLSEAGVVAGDADGAGHRELAAAA